MCNKEWDGYLKTLNEPQVGKYCTKFRAEYNLFHKTTHQGECFINMNIVIHS